MPKHRFKCIPAVHLFLIQNNEILLLRRYNTGYEDGNYSVLAGHLDGGESAIEAAQREAFEEGGITIAQKDLKFISVMHRNAQDERIDFFFEVTNWEGQLYNKEPNKCDELKWFPLDDLPPNIVPYVQQAISNHQTGNHFDTLGFD